MANAVLSRPRVISNQGRHAFDRSQVRNFNTHAGFITPIFMEPCIAGTKGKINRRVFTRSASVVAPNFTSVQQHFDFIKIPIRLVFSAWNDWKLNINDINSSALIKSVSGSPDLALPISVPCCDFGNGLVSRVTTNWRTHVPTVLEMTMAKHLNYMGRLLSSLGYGSNDQLFNSAGSSVANILSLIPLACYQKAYYDIYRNSTYESNNPFAYNLDWLYNANSQILDFTNVDQFIHFLDLTTARFVNYRNDYFHNIYPSLNYSQSSPNGSTWDIPSNVSGTRSTYTTNQFRNININGSSSLIQLGSNFSSNQVITAQSVRTMFALDKLLRASAYAPKHVRDQFKARFGVDVGDKVSHECQRLGSFVHDIVFGEVTSTSDVPSGSSLGEVGAKGVGGHDFNDKDIEFYCEEDSIILGVTYFMPRAMYDVALDEYNMKLYREDFFQDEFQNLGLRPIYVKNVYPDMAPSILNNIVGYTVPNQRYKLGRDINTGLFCGYLYDFDVNSGSVRSSRKTGTLQSFTTSNIASRFASPYSTGGGVNATYFKVQPEDLDSLFGLSFDSLYASQLTDQFYGQVRIKFAVTQGMSVHGQPSL